MTQLHKYTITRNSSPKNSSLETMISKNIMHSQTEQIYSHNSWNICKKCPGKVSALWLLATLRDNSTSHINSSAVT